MSEKTTIESLSITNREQLDFMSKYVRDFYTPAIVNWQYCQDDFPKSGLFFTKVEREYVASQGMIPIILRVKGEPVRTVKSESSFLRTEFRGKGVFEEIYIEALESSEKDGSHLCWGFTALSSVWRKKLGFQVEDGIVVEATLQLSAMSALSEIRNSKGTLREKMRRLLRVGFQSVKQLGKGKTKTSFKSRQRNFKLTQDREIILEAYKVWMEQHSNEIFIEPSRGFLQWRVVDNPVLKYDFYSVEENRKIVSIAIVNGTEKAAYLVDFICLADEKLSESFGSLVEHICRNKSYSNFRYWANSLNKTNQQIIEQFVKRGGFTVQNKEMNLVLRPAKSTNQSRDFLLNPANYYLNGLWTEGFRI